MSPRQKVRENTRVISKKARANSVSNIKERILSNNTDTERGEERRVEDEKFHSVIVKRSDETFRHADDILQFAIHEGQEQLNRPVLSLFMSSMAAGMIIGFTVLAVSVMAGILGNLEGINRVLVASVYPLGFVLCILSRTQLFTEHTATAIYPLLDKRASSGSVLKLWAIVIGGNLSGAVVISLLLTLAEPVIHAAKGYDIIALHIVDYKLHELLISAILAGWLMAIGAWTILSTPSTSSQIICIYIATFVIGIGGLHHSIAGSVELFLGLLHSDAVNFSAILPVLGVILLGNAIGGSIFVALVNHAHIRALNKV
jgi:formate/nitrite transporter FocA (FNT family)